jgi:hypothetical protein
VYAVSDERKLHARKVRLPRLKRLRELGAPEVIIRNEQILLACNRRGLKGDNNPYSRALRAKYVAPFVDASTRPWEKNSTTMADHARKLIR